MEMVNKNPCLTVKLVQSPVYNKGHLKKQKANFLLEETFLVNGFKHPLGLKGLRELPFSLKAVRVSTIGELTFATSLTPQSPLT